jgi:hypothetical protein
MVQVKEAKIISESTINNSSGTPVICSYLNLHFKKS